ncbi:syntaxin-8 [Eurosta solidaginis]|uniref:syntaxin-8 n=1 Tax=Eurosta solidaginis TaxID=178769 RepID=UPI0035314239
MSLLDVDSWSRECEACSVLNQAILHKLEQSEKLQENSAEYNGLIAAIQLELKQFEGEVKELKQKLDILEEARSIDPKELAHRKQQVYILQTQLVQVGRRTAQDTRWERAELFAQPSHSGACNSSENTSPTAEPLSNLNDLKQRQIDILERQNRGLEALSETISRQKNLASQLGQEVESQNDILDTLADTMDRVDTRVHLATGNISEVNRRDSTWGYWFVIIMLFVSILIVAVI